ncbi:hypothetical protein ACFLU4_02770 [Chloroflexota bacterium]
MISRFIYFCLVVLIFTCAVFAVPASAGTPDDSYKPERYYAADASTQTTTLAVYDNDTNDALTLTFTPPADKDFIVIASALTNYQTINNSTILHLLLGPTLSEKTSYSETSHKPIDTTMNWRGFGTHKILSATGGTSYTAKIQFKSEVGGVGETAYIKRCAIAVLEVFNYESVESNGESYGTHTVYSSGNKVTLNVTPSEEADYIIFATANTYNLTENKGTLAQIAKDVTGQDTEIETVTEVYASWGYMERETLAAVQHTFTMDYKSEAGGTAYIKDARIAVVLASDLGANQYAESEAASETELNTYDNDTNNKVTLTLSSLPTRNDYIIIGQGLGRNEATGGGGGFYANLDIDGTSYGEYVFKASDRNLYRSFFILTKVNLTAATHTVKIQYKADTTATKGAWIKNANVIAINANTVESYTTSGHTAIDNAYGVGENTAYTWAHGLDVSTTYDVVYYEAGASGTKITTNSGLTPTDYGNLSSMADLTTDEGAATGFWHAVVFRLGSSPPETYNLAAGNAGYVTEDSFDVAAEAIPEFSTIMAAISVSGLCFGAYYWLRKRRLGRIKV